MFDEARVDEAARELMSAAGRPYAWDNDDVVSEYEREAWRVCVRRVLTVYLKETK